MSHLIWFLVTPLNLKTEQFRQKSQKNILEIYFLVAKPHLPINMCSLNTVKTLLNSNAEGDYYSTP